MSHRIGRIAAAAALTLTLVVSGGCGGQSEAELLAAAKGLLAKQDSAAAVLQLKTVLQQNPESGEARFLLGRTLLETDNAAAAAVELERAHALKFDNDTVLPWLAKAMVVTGQAKKLIEQHGNVTLGTPQATAELKAAIAAGHVTLGQMGEGEAALKAALAADARNPSARLLMARLTAGRGAPDEALAQTEALLRDDPRQREAWLLKAQLLWTHKRDIAGSKKAFEEALAVDARFPAAYAGLVTLLLEQKEMPAFKVRVAEMAKLLPGRLETRYFEARVALLDADYTAARAIIQQLLKNAPKNTRVLQLAASLELAAGSLLAAESHLKKVLETAPDTASARRLLAQTYLRSGEPDKALLALRPLVETAQPTAPDLALVAESHLQSGDMARAEDYFQRAAKLNPDAANVRTALALTQIAKGQVDAGFAELESISSADKSSPYADLAMISARMRRNEFGEALKAIDRLQQKLPTSALPHQMRGRALMQQRNTAAARKSFEQALVSDPGYYDATLALVSLDIADRKPEDARKRYQAVLTREPNHQRAMVGLAVLMSTTGAKLPEVAELLEKAVQVNPEDSATRLAQIDHLLARRDTKAAATAAQAAVAALPADMAVLDALGRVQLASGNVGQALAAFSRVAAAQPNSDRAQLRLAEGLMAANEPENAVKALRRAVEIAPQSVAARRALVTAAVSRKRFDEALAITRQFQRDRPTDSMGWQLQSDVHALQRDWPAAIAAMRESLKRAPSSEAAIRMLELFAAADRPADAEAFVTTWQKANPQDHKLLFQHAAALLMKRDYARAESRFREVLALQPDDALALNNVAWLMVQQNKPGAAAVAERALKVAPNQAQVMDTLALALAAEGDVVKALDWQRKAMAQSPQEPIYRLGLARLLVQQGDKTLARAELDTLSKLGPGFAQQAEVSELLKRL